MDFYLKFASEEEARSVLYTVTPAVSDEETGVVTEETVKPNYMNIDVLGVIYEPVVPLVGDLTGEQPEPVVIDGWHVNVRTIGDEDGAALEPFKVMPKAPRRTWA